MWCSHVCYPFKKLLEYNSKYFSKNGFIQMIERVYIDGGFKARRRSFHIYCTVCDSLVVICKTTIKCANDHLKKCIAERCITSSDGMGQCPSKIARTWTSQTIVPMSGTIVPAN